MRQRDTETTRTGRLRRITRSRRSLRDTAAARTPRQRPARMPLESRSDPARPPRCRENRRPLLTFCDSLPPSHVAASSATTKHQLARSCLTSSDPYAAASREDLRQNPCWLFSYLARSGRESQNPCTGARNSRHAIRTEWQRPAAPRHRSATSARYANPAASRSLSRYHAPASERSPSCQPDVAVLPGARRLAASSLFERLQQQ